MSAPIDAEEKLEDLVPYGANQLIDAVINKLRLKNDVALCRLMGISPPEISNIRRGRRKVGATLLVRLHEASGISIEELRALIGDHGEKFRIGDKTSQATKY
nr:helix-turn-helix transcriptional regulator [Collimonas sp. OK607]